MNNPKAQFQINNGNGWQTIAEADIIDNIVEPPNAWTMARAMHKQIVYPGYYSGYTQEITNIPSPRDTHFSGFAVALFQEMQADLTALYVALGSRREQDITSAEAIIQQILARRAYDLACHVATHTQLTAHGDMSKIPDLPELPEVQE